MYNWQTDLKKLKKYPNKYQVWHLEQLINFGLNGEKISIKELKRHWGKLELDPKRRQLLEFWLWPKQS